MKQVTKEEFYKALYAEKQDIILENGPSNGTGKFYPLTQHFRPRYESRLFGKTISMGYINGIPTSEYYLNA